MRTMAVHVRYNFRFISLPSSTKQQLQREMTKFFVFQCREREARQLDQFFCLFVSEIQFRDGFGTKKQEK